MRSLAIAVAIATILTVPTSAKTFLKSQQRLLPDYVPVSNAAQYLDTEGQWTEGYPRDEFDNNGRIYVRR